MTPPSLVGRRREQREWSVIAAGLAISGVAGVLPTWAGPEVAAGLAACAFLLLSAAYILVEPMRALTLYAFLLPLDVYLSTQLRITAIQLLQVGIVVACCLRHLVSARRIGFPNDLAPQYRWTGGLLIGFLLWSLAWSIDIDASTRTVLRILGALLVAAVAILHIRQPHQLRRVVVAMSLGALVTALYGYAQYFRGGYDSIYPLFSPFYSEPFMARGGGLAVVATFSNPNILAAYGCIVLPLIWGLIADSRGVFRLLWLLTSVLLSGMILLTFSKAGWLVLAGLAGIWWLTRITIGPRLCLVGVGGICLGIVLLLLNPLLNTFVLLFPNSREASVDARLGLWSAAVFAFLQRPLLGFGLDGFAAATAGMRTGVLADLVRAHNWYLQLLVDLGIIGSVLFWTTLIVPFRDGLRAWRAGPQTSALHHALLVSASAFFLLALVDSLHVSTQYVGTAWLVFGLLAVSSRLTQERVSEMSPP
jgi:O-antigen ligase